MTADIIDDDDTITGTDVDTGTAVVRILVL